IFMNQIAEIVPDPNMLMFGDKAARDLQTLSQRQGHTLKGVCCVKAKVFVWGIQYSIIPIITLDGIITYDIVWGPVTSAHFLKFLWEYVIPLTTPYPGPRSVLVLDNCRIHHTEDIQKLVED
ncbi:hypothetical protein M404DRAFT_88330, partial [Pisolithus tinctorius Marx 270]